MVRRLDGRSWDNGVTVQGSKHAVQGGADERMTMSHTLNTEDVPVAAVNLSRINPEPGPYGMSFGFDLTRMMGSIQEAGMLNPPLIIANQEGGRDVVSGYRRMAAVRALGWKQVFCRDLSASNLSPLECLKLNLHENLPTRVFNDVEKGMILKRLSRHAPAHELLHKYMPLLGLSSHEPTLQVYLLIDDLEEPVKHSLAGSMISLQSVMLLLDMAPDARLAMWKCITDLRLNSNYQRRLIEYALDISDLEGKRAEQILAEGAVTAILKNQKLNNPQKAKVLLAHLHSRRNPRLAKSERAFRLSVSRLKLPDGVRISHPPYFESPSFTLEVSFRDGEALRKKIIQLAQMEGLENIRSPWLDEK
jgi:ParB-like chromosome segregation protein Spo0J